ncbi:hypothetical protein NicSoilB8_19790 [Arthrobacter sp. NicSoilB8]|nr:hypothetical protein NicSoilB8_19790 [Arthrobacter sp. NicSoilB8]
MPPYATPSVAPSPEKRRYTAPGPPARLQKRRTAASKTSGSKSAAEERAAMKQGADALQSVIDGTVR